MNTANPQRPAATRRSYLPFIVLGVILIVGVAIALVVSSGDDDTTDVGDAEADAGSDDNLLDLATASIVIDGEPLPPIPDGGEDPAIGASAPLLEGSSPAGLETEVAYDNGPTLLVFLAHWCPHCQEEVPKIVDLAGEGTFEGIRTVAVLTSTDEDQANYPPSAWLDDEGWTDDRFFDDRENSAAAAYGVTSFPFVVYVDADGTVVGRVAGGQSLEQLRANAEALRA